MRTSVLSLFMLVPGILAQESKTISTKPTIVFVCEHGSAKSIIAAVEFERMAIEKGLDLNIIARGTNPDAEIPKVVRDGLKSGGYDAGSLKPAKVSEKDLKGAARIVSFGPDLKPWLLQKMRISGDKCCMTSGSPSGCSGLRVDIFSDNRLPYGRGSVTHRKLLNRDRKGAGWSVLTNTSTARPAATRTLYSMRPAATLPLENRAGPGKSTVR